MPILTQSTVAQIDLNKQRLDKLNPNPSEIFVMGQNPIAQLEIESGGTTAQFQVIDEASSHEVMSIQYIRDNEEVYLALMNKTSGAWRTLLVLKSDGTATIGNGMTQHQIATDTDIGEVMNTLLGKIITKADKTSLPTIFSGEAEPTNALGKDLDWYHRFEAGSTIVSELYSGTSFQNYLSNDFLLMSASNGDIIEIASKNRLVFIDNVANDTLSVEDITLTIDVNAIPLEVVSNTAGSFVAIYNQSWDAVIENITTSTTFKVEVKEGVQSDKEYDYQKHNGAWFRTDFLNTEQVNDLIRSYHTIVVMALADDKKPTRAEAITAFKTLPNYDWAKNDTFYIRDSSGAKTMFCTYFADGATDEATAGPFFFKDMNECV